MADDSILAMIWARLGRFFNRPWVSIVVFGLLISLVAFWNRPPHTPMLNRGSEATFSYRSPYDFSYDSKILRKRKTDEAIAKVMPFYKIDNQAQMASLKAFRMIADLVVADYEKLRGREQAEIVTDIQQILATPAVVEYLKSQHIVPAKEFPETLAFIIQYSADAKLAGAWINSACDIYEQLSNEGIAANDLSFLSVRNLSQFNREFEMTLEDSLLRDVYAYNESRQVLKRNVRATMGMFSAIGLLKPNMVFDTKATKAAQDAAVATIPRQPVKVIKGDNLLVADELITDEVFERWQAFRQEMSVKQSEYLGGSKNFIANTLFILFVTLSAVLAGRMLLPDSFRRRGIRSPAICVGVLIFFNVLVVRLVLELMDSPTVDILLPNSHFVEAWLATTPIFAALVCTLIAGTPMAVVASSFLCGVIALMLDGDAGTFLPALSVSLAAIYWAKTISKRIQLLAVAFYAGLVISLVLIFVWCYNDGTQLVDWVANDKMNLFWGKMGELATNLIGILIAATFLGLLVAAMISPIERMFGLTSNITLAELTDFNHPLLRSLQYYAPGTYNHSVTVAAYAADAAAKIGANAVLCRCAGLFHDIGKIERAFFFTENQVPGTENPHNKLTPAISATIIRRHVKAGLVKADEYHLPQCVKDLIQQHHGRSYVGYFLKKAKELAVLTGDDQIVDLEKFRYDGPAPATKEAVVLLCCDIVEAASRSLKNPSVSSVETLVNKLIDERVAEGEFNESQITMRELSLIKKSLCESIITANHRRISYSQGEIKRDAEQMLNQK